MAEHSPDYRLDGPLARDVSAQVLLAVNYLHSFGIVHAGKPIFTWEQLQILTTLDIHPGNILFRVPELDVMSPEDFRPKISKVSRKDGRASEKGMPHYLVVPIKFGARHTLLEVHLIDFGGCKSFVQAVIIEIRH